MRTFASAIRAAVAARIVCSQASAIAMFSSSRASRPSPATLAIPAAALLATMMYWGSAGILSSVASGVLAAITCMLARSDANPNLADGPGGSRRRFAPIPRTLGGCAARYFPNPLQEARGP